MKILILGGYGTVAKNFIDIIINTTDHQLILLGRNEEKLEEIKIKYGSDRIKIICSDIKNFNENYECDVVINASSSLNLQEQILEKVLKMNCDYLDVHSPSKTNYILKDKFKNLVKNRTWIFDCGATSFIPFLSLINVSEVLHVGSLYKIFWDNKNLSQQTVLEYNNILSENETEDSFFSNNTWFDEKNSNSRQFIFGDAKCTYNGETKLVLKNIPSLKEVGFYVKTENLKFKENELTKIIVTSNGSSVSFFHEDGWYMTGAILFSILLEHIENKKEGVYFAGEYVNPESYIDKLKKLNVNIEVENGNN